MADPKNLIAIRRREIENEITRLLARVEALRGELPELEVAERVWARLSDEGAGNQERETLAEAAATRAEAVVAATKPPGTPTIPDMITTALMEALRKGVIGLEPRDMARYIANRWWPNVPSVAISPIAWRMWKRNDLEKDGPIYKLPRNAETADLLTTAGSAASQSNHQH